MLPRDEAMLEAAERVLTAYGLSGSAVAPISGGLINLTLAVTNPNGESFVLQCLNSIFAPEVNLNLELVTRHLAAHGQTTPRLVQNLRGEWWVSEANYCWRLLTFVPGDCYATLPSVEHAHAAGVLLGRFHRSLARRAR